MPADTAITEETGMHIPIARPAAPQGENGGPHQNGSADTSSPEALTSRPARPVTVFCVDDDPFFLGVVRTVIAATPGFEQVGEASSGEHAITAVASLRPDLLLMDVRMPGMDGFETARQLLERDPSVFIVFMSADPIEPPPRFDDCRGSVVFASKDELCPRWLLDLVSHSASILPSVSGRRQSNAQRP